MEEGTVASRARGIAHTFVTWLRTESALALCLVLTGCGTVLGGIVKGDQAVAIEKTNTEVVREQKKVTGSLPIALKTGDEVRTDTESTAVIRFESGSEVYLRPGSRVRIGSVTCTGFCELFVKVKGLFRVETEFVTAGAQGTSFWVKYEPRRDYKMIVTEGSVKLESNTGKWQPIVLAQGDKVSVTGTNPPNRQPATIEELNQIKNWVEQVEKVAPKSSLTTGQTIGIAAAIAAAIAIIISRDEDDDDDDRPKGGQTTSGWCCVDRNVVQLGQRECAARKGTYSTDYKALAQQCSAPPPVNRGPGAGTPR